MAEKKKKNRAVVLSESANDCLDSFFDRSKNKINICIVKYICICDYFLKLQQNINFQNKNYNKTKTMWP